MTRPKAYDPQPGYRYQLVARQAGGTYEHIDYATNRAEMKQLKEDYRLAFGPEWQIKAIPLPQKYWVA